MTYKYHCMNCFANWDDNILDGYCPECRSKLAIWSDYYNTKASMYDPVDKPAHYNQGKVECIDAIESALDQTEFIGYLKGQILKYIWREKHKGGLQDTQKAAWYLRKLVEQEAKVSNPK